MMAGRQRLHSDMRAAQRASNQRVAERARSAGLVQRSIRLPADCWRALRILRAPSEGSDAQTLERLLRASVSAHEADDWRSDVDHWHDDWSCDPG